MTVDHVVKGLPYEIDTVVCRKCKDCDAAYTVFYDDGCYNQFCADCTISELTELTNIPKHWTRKPFDQMLEIHILDSRRMEE